jgi:hypothetical protein
MKRLTNCMTHCMTTAAAVLMVTAGVASAQTVLKAEVPFAFHVGGKVMEPGTIRLRVNGGNFGGVIVNNYDAKRTYIVLPKSRGDAPKKWIASGQPRLGFDCSTGTCILARFWTGEGHAYQLYGPKTRAGETLLTEIVMKADKAD